LTDETKKAAILVIMPAFDENKCIEGRSRSRTKSNFFLRKDIEEEAREYDQGEVGYEEKNPLVRLFFDKKIKAVLRAISDFQPKPVRALDVGCGDGLLLEKLQSEHTVGFDLSVTRLKRAGLRAPNASLVCGDAEHLPFKTASFDLVTCLDTMEHLSNPKHCARGLESSTAKGGIMVIAIPDDRFLALARFLFLKYPFSLKGHGHVPDFKPDEYLRFFRRTKFLFYSRIPSRLASVVSLFVLKKVVQTEQHVGEGKN